MNIEELKKAYIALDYSINILEQYSAHDVTRMLEIQNILNEHEIDTSELYYCEPEMRH